MCSLFLCLLLCLANFSVVANAAENLVDKNLSNWIRADEDSSKSLSISTSTSGSTVTNKISISGTVDSIYDTAIIYSLPNLTIGESYRFTLQFDFDNETEIENFGKYATLMFGFAEQLTDGSISVYSEDSYLALDNTTVFQVGENHFTIEWECVGGAYPPCVFIAVFESSTSKIQSFTINDIRLERAPSATEKKLDGILGWLEDIKNSIVGLPETIKTNLSDFFTDLSSKLTELKNNIKTNLETLSTNITGKLSNVSTEFSGYITSLGDRVSVFFTNLSTNIKGFFDDIWQNISEWFEKFKPRIEIPLHFTYKDYYLSDKFIVYSDKFTLKLPYTWHLLRYNSDGTYVQSTIPANVEFNSFHKSYYTDYYEYAIKIYKGDVSTSLPGSIYVDEGWFSAFFDGLRFKIDVKVEEIKTSIHDFFVPPEGFFETWKAKFDLMLSDNLGFIYQAPNFVTDIVEVVQEILQTDQEVNLVFPEVEFDIACYHIELFKDTKVDFSFLEAGIWLTLYSMYKVMLYVIFALALIKYGMSTWERTMAN